MLLLIVLFVNLHPEYQKGNREYEQEDHVESNKRNQVDDARHYDLNQEAVLFEHSQEEE